MKVNRRKIIFISFGILFLFILFRILGFIDLNLYKSKMESNQIASIAHNNKQYSYDINFEFNGKTIYKHSIIKNSQKAILIKVRIDNYMYKGNYYLPILKNFSMEYKCTFSNITPENIDLNKIEGKVEGNIKTEINGVCSINQAKKISETKAIKSIKQYVIDSLNK